MWLYTILNVIVAILVIIALCYLGFRLFAWRQGNEHIVLLTKRRSPLQLEAKSFDKAVFTCDIPFVNKGKQNGTIMDLFPRPLLPEEQFDSVRLYAWTMDVKRPRHDGYFESYIVEPRKGGTIRLFLEMTATSGNVRKDLLNFPDMNVDIFYQVVGRSDYRISKTRIRISAKEIAQLLAQ